MFFATLWLLLWLWRGGLPARAQDAPSRPAPASAEVLSTLAGQRVAGQVVNALDGRPIAHAAVTLEDTKSDKVVAETAAREDGSYRFDAVPPGKYRLMAQSAGYLEAGYLAHPPFSTAIVTGAGLATAALTLKLVPFSEISGQVSDEAGEPLQAASVGLYRESAEGAQERTRRFRSGQTSDDGKYHFDALPPGRYYLLANAQPWYAVLPEANRGNEANQRYRSAVDPAVDVAYPTVFYPNAQNADGAREIVLSGGSAVVANLQMTPQPAITLTIRGLGADTGAPRFRQLTRTFFGQTEPVFAQAEIIDGTQVITGIAPGQYGLRQAQGRNGGSAGGTESVDLTTGSVTMEAPSAGALGHLAVTVQDGLGAALPGKLQLNLRAAGGSRVASSPVDEKGAASFAGVAPGDYRFALFGAGRLKAISSVSVNGHSLPEALLHVKGPGELAVTLVAGGNPVAVDGFARRADKPAVGAMVVLVPAGKNTDVALYRRDQSDLDGSFSFSNVIPGAYLLVAIEDGWSLRWDDPKALLPYLLHGIPVAVEANGAGIVHVGEAVLAQSR